VYAQDACRLFLRWGAVKITERIFELYNIDNDLAAREASSAIDMDEIPESNGKISNVLFGKRTKDHQKELEALNLEDAHKYFLDTICKEIGADNCAILLEEGDLLKLEYVRLNGQAAVKFPVGIDPEQVEFLPKKIIRYAGRTFEEVIIEAKPIDGPFANDDYIKKRPSISIICLPLKYNEIFTGLIYLESRNNNRFNSLTVEHIKHQSFYLVAKQALERETYGSNKIFINQTVKEQLTEREMEVLHCIAEGMTNKEIGEKLCISASTVKTHTINLYGKLEVNSRVQAVTKTKSLGLL
jgi:DNA-binding CsgD family transcriptional regulator